MITDPIEELRKWIGEGVTAALQKAVARAIEAHDAEVERLKADIQQLETGKYGRRELHAIIDKLTPELEAIKADRDRLHCILNHIAQHGIQTKNVTARIWMSEVLQKRPLLEVLEEEINRSVT